MFVFAFDEALFELNVNSPSSAPLFQFPPRIRTRHEKGPHCTVNPLLLFCVRCALSA
jgi:hypothetical protein